jgi:hypothetical protein
MSATPDAAVSCTAPAATSVRTRTRGSRGRQRTARSAGAATTTAGTTRTAAAANFKGETEEMNGHVFQCYEEQGDRRQYTKTVEALGNHAKKTLNYAEDLAPLFAEEMTAPTIAVPEDPGEGQGRLTEALWTEAVKEYAARIRALRSNMATIHAVIWGQCSEAMKAKIKSLTPYTRKATKNDCLWFLKQIKSVTLQFDSRMNASISLLDARASFLNCRQKEGQP